MKNKTYTFSEMIDYIYRDGGVDHNAIFGVEELSSQCTQGVNEEEEYIKVGSFDYEELGKFNGVLVWINAEREVLEPVIIGNITHGHTYYLQEG